MTNRFCPFCIRLAVLIAVNLIAAHACAENYAILIGINQYDNAKDGDCRLENLQSAVDDMTALQQVLITAKFATEKNVRLLTSKMAQKPTAANVRAAVQDVLNSAASAPQDIILLAFSGHGLSMEENGNTGDVLCCSDAKIVRFGQCEGIIRRSEIEEMLAKSAFKSKIFIIDACRSRPDETQNGRIAGARSIRGFGNTAGSSAMSFQPGIIRLASCATGQVSLENYKGIKNGVFTHFLVEGLRGAANKKSNNGSGNGKINLSELFEYAKTQTTKLTITQTPTKSEFEVSISTTELLVGSCAAEVPQSTPAQQPRNPAPPSRNNSGSEFKRNSGR